MPAERDRVERMVRSVDWAALEASSPLRGAGADRFQYRIDVEGEGGRRSVTAAEDAVPAELRPLVDWLLARR